MVTKAFINPELLRWARERYGLTTAAAAERLHVTLETMQEWETGESTPTMNQAQAVANSLSVPLGYLFLSEPPVERLPIPDLRRVPGERSQAPSPDLHQVVTDILIKQEWYREYQESEGADHLPFIGRYSSDDNANRVAADICKTIGIDNALRKRSRGVNDFLRLLVERVEAAGILVLRSGVVRNNNHRTLSVSEFRGFAISDPLAPLMFINNRDSKSAQIFTVGHELAHLWIGSSGISNPQYIRLPAQLGNSVELFCNHVAAEVLVPARNFESEWSDAESIQENLARLASHYRVSSFVILRRGYDLNKVRYNDYQETYSTMMGRLQATPPQNEGSGGNSYANLLVRNSKTWTRALVTAISAGTLSYRDAARMLHVKVPTINGLAERAFDRGQASSG